MLYTQSTVSDDNNEKDCKDIGQSKLKNLYLQILTTSSMPPVTINSSGSPAGGGEPTASNQLELEPIPNQLFNVHPKICLK